MPSHSLALRAAAQVALLSAAFAATAAACPPSISVELPRRDGSSDTSRALVIVHAFHGCHPGALTVSGTAEGLIGAARRTVQLDLEPTADADVYRVRRQWPSDGVWVLRLTVAEGGDHVTALVGVAASGRVAMIRQPSRRGASRPVSDADVDAILRSLAAG
jgi:hypothetical protein